MVHEVAELDVGLELLVEDVVREPELELDIGDGDESENGTGNGYMERKEWVCGKGRTEEGMKLGGYEAENSWRQTRCRYCLFRQELDGGTGWGIISKKPRAH